MERIEVQKIDDVHIKVLCDPGIKMELNEFFTFQVPGWKFMPAAKNGWDGKIRLFNVMTGRIYYGLIDHIRDFAKARDYHLEIDPGLTDYDKVPEDVAEGLAALFNTKYQPRYYQSEAVYHSLRYKRAILLSATSSGKSFIIYLIVRYLQKLGKKILIVVPTTSLVRQMYTDFIDYNNGEKLPFPVHQIEGGVDKNVKADLIISTWQSIYKQNAKWFSQFEAVIGDECHSFKAKSLTDIMEKMTECEYKLGFTGTLDGTQCNELVLQGLFGKAIRIVDAKTLIEDGTLVDFKIKGIVLSYSTLARKLMKKMGYPEEMNFIETRENRNKFIRNLAWNVKGNTLILYEHVEKHGKPLAEMLKREDKMVLFVSGQDSTDYREEVRRLTEANNNVIIVASYGVFRQGINIVNLDNLIFASPTKSKIRFLQSIGRVLRRGLNNVKATLYDIADDLSSKSWVNHTLRHFQERVRTYAEEGFEYSITTIDLKDDDGL